MSNHRFSLTIITLIVALTTIVVGFSTTRTSQAAQESTPLTDSMRALLADKQPPEELESLSFTPCVGGFAGQYPCDNIDLLSFIPLGTFVAGSGNDSWGWTDPLDGKEYAIIGLNNGTGFVDISDPENPVYLGKLPTHTFNSSWRDIKVYADHAFVVSEASGHGMQVFDLTELRNVTSPPVTFSETAHYTGFGSAHNIVINEDSGYAYGVGTNTCSAGLHFVNIQNPTSPVGEGCFSSDGYTHDAQCVNYVGPDPDHQGKEICFNSNEDTLTIVDVTSKSAPVQLSRNPYSGSGYTHQGWLAEDHRSFFLSDELDELSFGHNSRTRIWDVTDLDNPTLIDFHDGRTPAIDHNLYVHNGNLYEANYRSGLSILDASDAANGNLTEIGYFDIYPANDSPNFNGAWSTYPYFDSGVVIISGIEQGLFVVRPTDAAATLSRSPDSFEETINLGEVVSNTLVVSNTGGISFTFAISSSVPWASVSPSGGTLNAGESMTHTVVFDSLAAGGEGTFNGQLDFTGTYNNMPLPVDLIMHVNDNRIYLPLLFK